MSRNCNRRQARSSASKSCITRRERRAPRGSGVLADPLLAPLPSARRRSAATSRGRIAAPVARAGSADRPGTSGFSRDIFPGSRAPRIYTLQPPARRCAALRSAFGNVSAVASRRRSRTSNCATAPTRCFEPAASTLDESCGSARSRSALSLCACDPDQLLILKLSRAKLSSGSACSCSNGTGSPAFCAACRSSASRGAGSIENTASSATPCVGVPAGRTANSRAARLRSSGSSSAAVFLRSNVRVRSARRFGRDLRPRCGDRRLRAQNVERDPAATDRS